MAKADMEAIKKAKDGLDVLPDIRRYAVEGFDAIVPEDMALFRWYGVYEQQPKNGHFMMRVRIPGGVLNSDQLRAVAHVSKTYGNNIADITTRQNFQFHWLTIQDIPVIIDLFNSVGLSTAGACGDIMRNICGCSVAGIDPGEIYDTRPIIAEIAKYFVGNKDYSDLPRKYKLSISGCPIHCNQPEINDLAIQAVRYGKEVRFEVRVGGGLSTQPHFAKKLSLLLKPEQILDVVIAITEIFRDEGYRSRRNHARLKFLVQDWGAEKFQAELVKRLGWTPETALPMSDPKGTVLQDHLGLHPQKQDGKFWIGASVITGRVTGDQLEEVARIIDTYCENEVRTTNQQNFLFPNIPADKLDEAMAAIRNAGFEWEVSEFHKGAVSCTGNEFCNLAITETKGRLREVISHLEKSVEYTNPIRIHLNGCPNSCGQHHIGDIGLQGCLARQQDGTQIEAYDICLGGRLGEDAKFVRPIQRKVPAEKVKFALEGLLRNYNSGSEENESFGKWVDRHTDAELGAFLGEALLVS